MSGSGNLFALTTKRLSSSSSLSIATTSSLRRKQPQSILQNQQQYFATERGKGGRYPQTTKQQQHNQQQYSLNYVPPAYRSSKLYGNNWKYKPRLKKKTSTNSSTTTGSTKRGGRSNSPTFRKRLGNNARPSSMNTTSTKYIPQQQDNDTNNPQESSKTIKKSTMKQYSSQQQQNSTYYNPTLTKKEMELASHLLQYQQILFLHSASTKEEDKWWKQNQSSPSSSVKENEQIKNQVTLEQLAQSEHHYKEMCRLLSQIIKMYSFMPFPTNYQQQEGGGNAAAASSSSSVSYPPFTSFEEEQEDIGVSSVVDPIKRAEEFLDQYENIRNNRLQLIQEVLRSYDDYNSSPMVIERAEKKKEEKKDRKEKESMGLVQTIQNFFFAPTTSSLSQEYDEEEETLSHAQLLSKHNIEAHVLSKYIPSEKLYHAIIKGVMKRAISFNYPSNEDGYNTNTSITYYTNPAQQQQTNESTAVTAVRLLKKLKHDSSSTTATPNEKIYNDVIKACCRVGKLSFAKRGKTLLREMQQLQQQQQQQMQMGEQEEESDFMDYDDDEEEDVSDTFTEETPKRKVTTRRASSSGNNRFQQRRLRRQRRRPRSNSPRRRQASIPPDISTDEDDDIDDDDDSYIYTHQKQLPIYSSPQSNPITYNHVMGGFKNTISQYGKNRTSRKQKRIAVEEVEELFHEISSQQQQLKEDITTLSDDYNDLEEGTVKLDPKTTKTTNSTERNSVEPNLTTYNLLLATYCHAGHDIVPDVCEKVDTVLIQLIGKEAFSKLVGEESEDSEYAETKQNGNVQDKDRTNAKRRMEPDMIMLHHLIEIYASTNERKYVNRSIHLLHEMERRKQKSLKLVGASSSFSEDGEEVEEDRHRPNHRFNSSARYPKASVMGGGGGGGVVVSRNDVLYPKTTTYNNILRGLVKVQQEGANDQDHVYRWNSLTTKNKKWSNPVSGGDNRKNDGGTHMSSSPPSTTTDIQGDEEEKDKTDQFTQDAIYASTHLLDSMISHESSLPNQVTYIMLLKLWGKTNSPLAGEKAEEIVSRMDVVKSMYHHHSNDDFGSFLTYSSSSSASIGGGGNGRRGEENVRNGTSRGGGILPSSIFNIPRPDAYIYQLAMECWIESAFRSQPSAAMSALALLDRAEGQCRRIFPVDITSPLPSPTPPPPSAPGEPTPSIIVNDNNNSSKIMKTLSIYNEAVRPNENVYTSLIKVCANTKRKADMAQALQISFDVYNRMIDHGIQPTANLYAYLLSCCANLMSSSSSSSSSYYGHSSSSPLSYRKRMELAETVFEAACHQGQVNNFVLKNLKRANYPLYESYVPSPEHSARVGLAGGTTAATARRTSRSML